MPPIDDSKPSFSSGRRWLGGLNATVAAGAALAMVAMFNYLASSHFMRFDWSRDAAFKLSRQTKAVMESLTNKVEVTIFFNPKDDPEIYDLTQGLLNEYQNANPRHVHVTLLDYTLFPSQAKDLLAKYNLTGSQEQDFVLIESGGHHKVVFARELAEHDLGEGVPGRSQVFVRRSAFKGEMLFTGDIFAVSNPQTLKTYFLYGHGENDPGDPSGDTSHVGHLGFTNLANILKQEIDSDWDRLSLLGTNDIPKDCQLLIVAGPKGVFLPEEVNKIAAYLKNGGRLLALLPMQCGLEPMLDKLWGVQFIGTERVADKDPKYSYSTDYFFTAELCPPHPVINALIDDMMSVLMVPTRPVYKVADSGKIPGAPEVKILAATSKSGMDEHNHAGSYPLMAAIEQGAIKGVDTPRDGRTRIVVVGDSDFLDDQMIKSWQGNTDFAYLALTWLLQRPQLMLEGLMSQPIKEYKLYLTAEKSATVRWLFLAGMPASILALGGLVWLRRRH